MRGRFRSEAERMHQHNEEMRLALAEGISLSDARWRLFQQRMEAADRARNLRLAVIGDENRARRDEQLGTSSEDRPHFWWEDRD